jgi:hypothetical protein
MVQFSFSNINAVPIFATRLRRPEKPKESAVRRTRSTGFQVIEPTLHTGLALLLDELTIAGYSLVDAIYQERIGGQDQTGTYNMIRFEFARAEKAQITSVEFHQKWDDAINGFRGLCEDAMWRVRGFNNPYYLNGAEIPGQRTLSLNMEGREPFIESNGQPIMVWQKDALGRKIMKVPVRPVHRLQIASDAVGIADLAPNSVTV